MSNEAKTTTNEIRLRGTVKFPPREFSLGVGVVVQPHGEQAGVDCTAWTADAPEAAALLGRAQQGDEVSILGKLVRKKDKQLTNASRPGDVYVLGVNVLKARVDAAAARPAPAASDDDIAF